MNMFLNCILTALFKMAGLGVTIISDIIKRDALDDSQVVTNIGYELYYCSQSLLRLVTNFDIKSIANTENFKQVRFDHISDIFRSLNNGQR